LAAAEASERLAQIQYLAPLLQRVAATAERIPMLALTAALVVAADQTIPPARERQADQETLQAQRHRKAIMAEVGIPQILLGQQTTALVEVAVQVRQALVLLLHQMQAAVRVAQEPRHLFLVEA
jgi:hypothetical protein